MSATWKGVHGALLDNLCLSLEGFNPELPSWLLPLLMNCALSLSCKQLLPREPAMGGIVLLP